MVALHRALTGVRTLGPGPWPVGPGGGGRCGPGPRARTRGPGWPEGLGRVVRLNAPG